MEHKNYYKILDVPQEASQATIKEQYRLLMQVWHPDRFSNLQQRQIAQEKAKEINEAYSVLNNAENRAKYDSMLNTSKTNSQSLSQTNTPFEEWFNGLPSWAQGVIAIGGLGVSAWISIQQAQAETARKQERYEMLTKQAKSDVSELIDMDYGEAVRLLSDLIPRIDPEYWLHFEREMRNSATSLKSRNLLARALEIRKNTSLGSA